MVLPRTQGTSESRRRVAFYKKPRFCGPGDHSWFKEVGTLPTKFRVTTRIDFLQKNASISINYIRYVVERLSVREIDFSQVCFVAAETRQGRPAELFGRARGDLGIQVKAANLSKRPSRHDLGECAKLFGLGKVLAHDDSIFARNTFVTLAGVPGCSARVTGLSKCGRFTECPLKRIGSGRY